MKIESIIPVTDRPNTICKFNILTSEGFLIRDCKLMRSSNGMWVSFPSRQYKDKEGKNAYFDLVMIPKETREALSKLIIDLLQTQMPQDTPTKDYEVPF